MSEKTKEKVKGMVFVGGKLRSPNETRGAMIEIYDAIVREIKSSGFGVHPNFLTNRDIELNRNPPIDKVRLGGVEFNKIMGGVTTRHLFSMGRYRDMDVKSKDFDREAFRVCLAVGRIISDQLSTAVAGVFNLSEESQGSGVLIGQMLGNMIPVLAVSMHDNFGTVIIGNSNPLLMTKTCGSVIEVRSAVKRFLHDIWAYRMAPRNVRFPLDVQRAVDIRVATTGRSITDVITHAVRLGLMMEEKVVE